MEVDVTASAGEIKRQIDDAVRFALLEQTAKQHEKRIGALEGFRWWLVGGIAAGSIASFATLVITIATTHGVR